VADGICVSKRCVARCCCLLLLLLLLLLVGEAAVAVCTGVCLSV